MAQHSRIEEHGIIGDQHTVALVATDGTIDFLCFPSFDSPTIFAALLDPERGGSFRLAPVLEEAGHKQLYLPDSNILLTRFLSAEGVAEVSDFMPVEETHLAHNVIRRAKCVHGRVRFRMRCAPRFDYARGDHDVRREGERVVAFVPRGDGTPLRLRAETPLEVRDGDAVADFTLRTGETVVFVLEAGGDAAVQETREFAVAAFKTTLNYWRTWVARCPYEGRWRETVRRSALTLKLLVSQPHGSLVAAPTFGLPEALGGERNWDYRYTWIRDACFTVDGLMRLGFPAEAGAFVRWIEERCAGDGDRPLQTVYAIDGGTRLTEYPLPHLRGYGDSRPVRVGNAACEQHQLDIYGELLAAVDRHDEVGEPVHHSLWERLVSIVDWVCANWDQPDEGIWEVRAGRFDFLYSRVLCWVALDRALRLARRRSLPAPVARWRRTRDAIYRTVHGRFFHEGRQAFVQRLGSDAMDASALAMPLMGFISPTDPRWRSTMRAIEDELVEDSLVYRYRPRAIDDDLAGREGTFSICSFWYAEVLARMGDVDQARLVFEKMLGYANHLGLYAEEIGPRGEHLGNFPQAFTHLALVSAALHLDEALTAHGERG